ncbi:MAG: Fic family protein [Halocynthiibacter sp.]
MDYKAFEKSPAGNLVPTVSGERAFVPNKLPPKFDLGSVALDLAMAMNAIGELRGACWRLQNPYILIRPLQRLEAQTSSAMEGTHTTTDELVLTEAGVEKNPSSDAREVANYAQSLAWAVHSLENLPVSGRLLRGAHKRLLQGVGRERGQNKLPGEFKREQNMIGGRRLDRARFIPPPPAEAENSMSDLEYFLNREHKTGSAPLIDMAMVHYQFETIHPFADGNGRVGRMLISLMALSEGLLELPVLYMSPDLETRKDDYIDLLYRVSAHGEWTEWISFFLDVLANSCHRAVTTIDRIIGLQEDYQARAANISQSSNMIGVVNLLFESPIIQPKVVVRRIGITDAAARNLLRQLTEIGILDEVRQFYPRVWIARELVEISRPDND